MTNNKQCLTNSNKEEGKISVSAQQDQEDEKWSRYFELGILVWTRRGQS
ncbi:hypothetical protein [Candidatus Rickettsia colombianensi]|nr:hypothetical protein [Candidatus Rickettsia colombianensi]